MSFRPDLEATRTKGALMDDMSRLMIEHDCTKLIVAYSHMIDFGDAGSIAELFTDNASRFLDGEELRNVVDTVDFY